MYVKGGEGHRSQDTWKRQVSTFASGTSTYTDPEIFTYVLNYKGYCV